MTFYSQLVNHSFLSRSCLATAAHQAAISLGRLEKTKDLVEPSGIEPLTSTLPVLRSPS